MAPSLQTEGKNLQRDQQVGMAHKATARPETVPHSEPAGVA